MDTARRLTRLSLPLLVGGVVSCGDAGGPSSDRASFELIQAEVFAVYCITCHTEGTSFAQQSGLVLDAGVAYENLVDVAARNPKANEDGLLRVAAGEPERSLLIHKLHWEPDYSPADYGSSMPLGSRSLSVGQIEFVRRWILAGASRTGKDVDPHLLGDMTRPNLEPFVPPPPPGSGFQLTIDRFGVEPQFERELFVYRRVGNAVDVYVNRIETVLRPNSHHFVLYSFPDGTPADVIPPYDVIRDIRNPDGSLDPINLRPMAYHLFFGGAMGERSDWQLPPGVALRLPANASLDLNTHYVNRTEAELRGEVYTNLYTIDSATVQHIGHALNLGNFGISLPAGQRTTLTKTFPMSDTVNVFLLTSHMHEHGEHFTIKISGGSRDGETVYETEDWDNPDIRTYDPPLVLYPGEGLTSVITYNNTTGRTITFGLTSQDEMGIIFGYFYQ